MKHSEWALIPGSEWQDSVDRLRSARKRLDHNLEALLDGLRLDPFSYSRPLIAEDANERYGTTKDVAYGYRLVVFVHVLPNRNACELGWVAAEDI